MKTKNILNFLDSNFPIKNGEDWDNNGLIFGNKNKKIDKILITLDLTNKILEEALLKKVDLIITHHPVAFFKTEKEEFEKAPYKKKLFEKIKINDIAIISMHTCYDSSKNGTWLQVVRKLEIKKFKRLKKSKYAVIWENKKNLKDIKKHLSNKLNLSSFKTNIKSNSLIFKKVALIPGSGSIEEIINCINEKADLVITSDIKWSHQITAKELKINLIEISHSVENVFVEHLYEILSKKYSKIKVYKKLINQMLF